jgi:Arc/MetJ-type ribon-helix-helix transcriptional regulator
MNSQLLPPELQRFADEAVASGRFADTADLFRAAVSLLQKFEAERAEFAASLEAAQAEGDRDGFLTIEESMRDIDALIEDMASASR